MPRRKHVYVTYMDEIYKISPISLYYLFKQMAEGHEVHPEDFNAKHIGRIAHNLTNYEKRDAEDCLRDE